MGPRLGHRRDSWFLRGCAEDFFTPPDDPYPRTKRRRADRLCLRSLGHYGWQIKGPGRSSRFQRFRSDTVVNQGLASCFAYPASVLTHPRRSPSIIPADFGSAATTLMSWLPSAPASSGPERHVRRSESDFLRVRAHRADRRQSRTTLGRGGVTGHRRRDRCGSPRPQASIPHHADGGLDLHATHRFDVEGNSWLPCYNGTVARFDRSRLRPGTVDEPDLVLA